MKILQFFKLTILRRITDSCLARMSIWTSIFFLFRFSFIPVFTSVNSINFWRPVSRNVFFTVILRLWWQKNTGIELVAVGVTFIQFVAIHLHCLYVLNSLTVFKSSGFRPRWHSLLGFFLRFYVADFRQSWALYDFLRILAALTEFWVGTEPYFLFMKIAL